MLDGKITCGLSNGRFAQFFYKTVKVKKKTSFNFLEHCYGVSTMVELLAWKRFENQVKFLKTSQVSFFEGNMFRIQHACKMDVKSM